MPRLDEETLQAYLDGELPARQAALVSRAERSSPRVARPIEELRRLAAETWEHLDTLDVPLSPEAVRAAEEKVFARGATAPARRRRKWVGRAAGLVLLVAGGGALTVAAEPVRAWLASLRTAPEAPGPGTPDDVTPRAPSGAAATPATASAGTVLEHTELGVEALDGRLDVRIETLRPGVRISVDVGATGLPRAVAEARAGLRSGPGVIALSRVREPVFVAIPLDVAHATLRIDGRTYLEVRSGTVILGVRPEERLGDTLVFVSGATEDPF